MFSIGEKVVCIHNFSIRESAQFGEVAPIKGQMYTIRTIELSNGEVYLRFEELINPVLPYANGRSEVQFLSIRFRKLDHDFADKVLAEIKEAVLEETPLEPILCEGI